MAPIAFPSRTQIVNSLPGIYFSTTILFPNLHGVFKRLFQSLSSKIVNNPTLEPFAAGFTTNG